MISVKEATGLIAQHTARPRTAEVKLADALGRTLAADVASDVDSPPHDKAMVDGYAIVATDLAGDVTELAVVEEVTAGKVPTRGISSGQATRIMTGAPVPAGADAVVMVERTELVAAADETPTVRIEQPAIETGKNIMRRGTSLRRGEVVLSAGCRIGPKEIGLLAEVGRGDVPIFAPPTVAVLATGDELVPAGETPAAGQIRNSNSPMLAALATECGTTVNDLGIVRDDEDALRRAISRGLEADVLVLSGGVSAGVLDLVPEMLAELGVEQVFHKVRLKPGKPLWFGLCKGGDSRPCLVFGLPGNPVSSFVCFTLFVRPALASLAGIQSSDSAWQKATLTEPFQQRGDRPTYYPAVLRYVDGRTEVTPTAWKGSADLRGFAEGDCLVLFPAPERRFEPGELLDVLYLAR